jgi:N-acyl-D-aspartate/D-glutamate deacylase
MEYDILIKDAVIVEGTGENAYNGSLGIKDGKVVATGDVGGDAVRIIEAEGLTAVPGFIDAHSHADWALPWYPKCESFVRQGVTTFVGGQCGGSPAPLGEYVRIPWMLMDHLQDLDPYKYYPNKPYYPLEQVNEWMEEIYGFQLSWDTMADYFNYINDRGISINYAPLVGQGTVRTCVMGLDYKRHSTDEEQEEMHKLIHEAMEDGCIGMSTGLDYDPGVFASLEEITECVRQIKGYGGVYCPHWRRTGRRRGIAAGHVPNEKITALMECVGTYKETGVRLHFAHLSTGWEIYPTPPDELEEANLRTTINMITSEAEEELDITWDAIPSLIRGGFSVMPYLCSLLEPWLRELGGREELAKWLKVEEFREEVKEAIREGKWFIRVAYNPNTNPRWAENIFVIKSEIPDLDGKNIDQIAQERDEDPFDTWLNIIAEDPHARGVTATIPARKAYYQYYTHPLGMVGLDTLVCDDKYERESPPYSIPGINTYSAFPLFFKKFVNDEGVFTVEEAVKKTSTMAARVHNLEGRGTIGEGSYADIVLMDLPKLEILSTEVEPRRYPKGVNYVMVNGVLVVDGGEHTGNTPGSILTR